MIARPYSKSGRPDAAGFTLLEVLLAVAIFAFTLLAVFVIGANSTNEGDLTDKVTKADFLVREKMADVVLGEAAYQDGESGTYEDPELEGFTWHIGIEDIPFLGVSPEDAEEANGSKDGKSGSGSRSSSRGSGKSSQKSGSSSGNSSSSQSKGGSQKQGGKKGGGGDLFGGGNDKSGGDDLFGGDAPQEEWLQKITVEVSFPYHRGPQVVRAVTYVPMESEEEEESDDSGSKKKSGKSNESAKNSGSGGKASKNEKRK